MNTNTLPQVPRQIAIDSVTAITDKQIAFIAKMIERVEIKVGTNTTTEAVAALEFIQQTKEKLMLGTTNKRQASSIIGLLIRHEARNYDTPTTPTNAPLGVYKHGGEIYRVVKARQSENRYAQKLITIEGRAPRWDIAYGFVRTLKVEELISPEVAAQMGRAFGYCVICGRFLSDPESIAKGIGPVCYERVSVNYGNHSPLYGG